MGSTQEVRCSGKGWGAARSGYTKGLLCLTERMRFAPQTVEEWTLAGRLVKAAQRSVVEVKIEWDGVADLSRSAGVIPVGHVEQVYVSG